MKKWIAKWRYEWMCALLLLVQLLYYWPKINETIDYCIKPYAMSYQHFGFISRGLIGSILRMIRPMLTHKEIYLFIALQIVLLCALTLYVIHELLIRTVYATEGMGGNSSQTSTAQGILANSSDRSSALAKKNPLQWAVLYLVLAFLANPGSISFLFYWGNFGRLDLFLIMNLMIVALLLIKVKKHTWVLFLIPILCVLAEMTHQAYVFQYFPAVMVLLWYRAYGESEHRDLKEGVWNGILFWLTGVLVVAMFFYLQLAAKIPYSYEETIAILRTNTDLPVVFFDYDMMVRVEYFSDPFKTFHVLVYEPALRNLFRTAVTLVFMIPFLGMLLRVWKIFSKEQKGFLGKYLPLVILVGEIPMLILTCDYGRDYSAILISYFVLIFTFLMQQNAAMKKAVTTLGEDLMQRPEYFVWTLVLIGLVGMFQSGEVSELGDHLYQLVLTFMD